MSLTRTIATNLGTNTVKPCSKFSNTICVPYKDPGLEYLGEQKIDIVKLFNKITQFDLIRDIMSH